MAQVFYLFTTFWLSISAKRRLRLLFLSFAATHTRTRHAHTNATLAHSTFVVYSSTIIAFGFLILRFSHQSNSPFTLFVLPAFAAVCCCFRSFCCCTPAFYQQQQKILSTNCTHSRGSSVVSL